MLNSNQCYENQVVNSLNANYAQYFNKKAERTSHLWQNHYKSRYVIFINYDAQSLSGFLGVEFTQEDLTVSKNESYLSMKLLSTLKEYLLK